MSPSNRGTRILLPAEVKFIRFYITCAPDRNAILIQAFKYYTISPVLPVFIQAVRTLPFPTTSHLGGVPSTRHGDLGPAGVFGFVFAWQYKNKTLWDNLTIPFHGQRQMSKYVK